MLLGVKVLVWQVGICIGPTMLTPSPAIIPTCILMPMEKYCASSYPRNVKRRSSRLQIVRSVLI